MEAVKLAAQLMAAAARTAPKARGLDSIQTLVLTGEDLEALAVAMEARSADKGSKVSFFGRDADNVRQASAVLLVGVRNDPRRAQRPLDCGACGFEGCIEFFRQEKREGEDFRGPICAFQLIDLGVALGSAARTAADMNIDNRMMYSIGTAARKMGLLDSDLILGIPLSATGKNPFFDRPIKMAERSKPDQ